MKTIKLITYIISLISVSHSVYIKYKGLSSDNNVSYTELVKQIKNDPNLDIYNRLRSFLASRTLPSGPLIAPHWFVRGVHTDPKNEPKIINGVTFYHLGTRQEQPRFQKRNSYPIYNTYFVQCNNTDIGLYYCYRLDNQPIQDQYIIERATASDINNKENRFFALTRSLHDKNGNCWNNCSPLEDDVYIIPCKSTNQNPNQSSSLTFEIDNNQFPQLYFETYAGDSCSPMLLLTKEHETEEHKLKAIGPHFPGKNSFNVVNMAFPSNKNFIDGFLDSFSVQNMPKAPNPINTYEKLWFNYENITKSNDNKYQGILVSPQCFLFLSEAPINDYIQIDNRDIEIIDIKNIGSAFKLVFCKEYFTNSIKINNKLNEDIDYYIQLEENHNSFHRIRISDENIDVVQSCFDLINIIPIRFKLCPSSTRLKGVPCINSYENTVPTLLGLYYEIDNIPKIRFIDNQFQAQIQSEILNFALK